MEYNFNGEHSIMGKKLHDGGANWIHRNPFAVAYGILCESPKLLYTYLELYTANIHFIIFFIDSI